MMLRDWLRYFTLLLAVWLLEIFTSYADRHSQGEDYPSLTFIPRTTFDCKIRPVGYYADPDPTTKCQVYHMCDMKGNKFSYLCPNGTLFHQQHLICAHWYQVNCSKTLALYEINKQMFPFEKFADISPLQARKLVARPRPLSPLPSNGVNVEGTPPPLDPAPTILADRIDEAPSAFGDLTPFIISAYEDVPSPGSSDTTDQLNAQLAAVVPTENNSVAEVTQAAVTSGIAVGTSETTVIPEEVPKLPREVPLPVKRKAVETVEEWPRRVRPAQPRITFPPTTPRTAIPTGQVQQEVFRVPLVGLLQPSSTASAAPPSPDTTAASSEAPLATGEPKLTVRFLKDGNVKKYGFMPLNEKCPLCNPYFLKNGQCSPCVIIR